MPKIFIGSLTNYFISENRNKSFPNILNTVSFFDMNTTAVLIGIDFIFSNLLVYYIFINVPDNNSVSGYCPIKFIHINNNTFQRIYIKTLIAGCILCEDFSYGITVNFICNH